MIAIVAIVAIVVVDAIVFAVVDAIELLLCRRPGPQMMEKIKILLRFAFYRRKTDWLLLKLQQLLMLVCGRELNLILEKNESGD